MLILKPKQLFIPFLFGTLILEPILDVIWHQLGSRGDPEGLLVEKVRVLDNYFILWIRVVLEPRLQMGDFCLRVKEDPVPQPPPFLSVGITIF